MNRFARTFKFWNCAVVRIEKRSEISFTQLDAFDNNDPETTV
jgi:hypothetical protein